MLNECYTVVWGFRRNYSEFWPTPSPIDSLRYAYTEAGEALSDWLRENRQDHKRNHAHETDVLGELADCAIMLLTALPNVTLKDEDEWLYRDLDGMARMDAICVAVAQAIYYYDDSPPNISIIQGLNLIAAYPGMNLEVEISKRFEKIFGKHVAPKVDHV